MQTDDGWELVLHPLVPELNTENPVPIYVSYKKRLLVESTTPAEFRTPYLLSSVIAHHSATTRPSVVNLDFMRNVHESWVFGAIGDLVDDAKQGKGLTKIMLLCSA